MNVAPWPWVLLLAPIAGSFLSVVIARFDAPQTIIWGRSRCPECRTALATRDLFPIVSWIALRGRCRHCTVAISPRYLIIELAAVVIAVWAITVVSGWALWATVGLGWVLLALAIIDWQEFVLPDFLTLPLVPTGLFEAWESDRSTVADHAIGAAVGFGTVLIVRWVYWRLRRREGIGLGDAKVLAAAGAWTGWEGLPLVVLIGSIAGLIATVVFQRKFSPEHRVPFGTFLALGTWLVWLYSSPF